MCQKEGTPQMKKRTYWAEPRAEEDRLLSGISIPGLMGVDVQQWPWVVITTKSVSALGQLVCLCADRKNADEIADRMEFYEELQERFG